jgi:LysR family transcriptional regulator, benzoate and cis,cis-muconate-responsive activator of ben and cat genes
LPPPEIRLQVAALTLAEELNFTRAAERLRITQPALSKQIAELERRLGFCVFERDQKRVTLSEAGTVYIRGCSDAIAILEKAERLARATQENIQPLISIGHSPYIDPALVSCLLGIHLPLYPNLRLRMESMFALDLVHSVLSAELDLAIVAEPSPNPLLTLVPLDTSPIYTLMSREHPAASLSSVCLKDLDGVGWMMFPRKANPTIYDRLIQASRDAAINPVELHHYLAPQEAVQLISENFGVAFTSKGVAEQIGHGEIVARSLALGALDVTNYLVLRADQSSRLVNEFGRAFLKRAAPNSKHSESSGQLLLGL